MCYYGWHRQSNTATGITVETRLLVATLLVECTTIATILLFDSIIRPTDTYFALLLAATTIYTCYYYHFYYYYYHYYYYYYYYYTTTINTTILLPRIKLLRVLVLIVLPERHPYFDVLLPLPLLLPLYTV